MLISYIEFHPNRT